jgi:hypothetical protein
MELVLMVGGDFDGPSGDVIMWEIAEVVMVF